MPMLCGEGENVFCHLQDMIVAKLDDQTLLACSDKKAGLAPSLSSFASGDNLGCVYAIIVAAQTYFHKINVTIELMQMSQTMNV